MRIVNPFKTLKSTSVVALASLAMAGAYAQAPETSKTAIDPLNSLAPYAYIIDADTGQTLYCKSCDEKLIPASMSKLMTYYIVFERIKDGRVSLDDEFVVSEHAWRTGGAGTDGSTMFLELGSKVRVEDLIRGAVVQSGNDACIVLAEGISGSESAFAEEMTRRAQAMGLTQSTFVNSTGLDHPDQRMSAADIGKLSLALINEFPEMYKIFSENEFTWNGIRQFNRNPLLREVDGADGVKTGHLSASGFGVAGSAVRNGQRRVVVLQGMETADDRRKESSRMMRAAFNDFTTQTLATPDSVVAEAEVWLGTDPSVSLVIKDELIAAMHVESVKTLRSVVHYTGPIAAPVSAGDEVGELVFTADGMAPKRIPVYAGADVGKLGLIGRALAGLRAD